MERHFDNELLKLKQLLLNMGCLVEKMINLSIKGFREYNFEISKEIFDAETEVNDLQIEIDEHVIQLLALMQPLASDLRFLLMASRMSSDLERIGDLAVNMIQNTKYLIELQKEHKELSDLTEMGKIVQMMFKESIEAFVNKDDTLAKKVLESDSELDSYKRKILDQNIKKMTLDSSTIGSCIPLILISRNLERIGDHATNVAEEVIYLVKGIDVRHHHEEKKLYKYKANF